MQGKLICPYCFRGIESTRQPDLYLEQTGWSLIRAQGGSNQLSLRRPTGRYAHGSCIRLAVRGVDPQGQGRFEL